MIQFLKFIGISFIIAVNLMASCNLENDIDLELPAYEPEMVVECYLQPGRDITLTLIEGNAYLDPYLNTTTGLPNLQLISGAIVTVSYGGTTDTLSNSIGGDIDGKLFNYTNGSPFPALYNTPISLRIEDPATGRIATATTEIIPNIPIDSTWIDEGTGPEAIVLTSVTDPTGTENFYRRMLHVDSLLGSNIDQDFVVDDQFVSENGAIIFGSGPGWDSGDTLITTIWTINEEYYRFYTSVDDAVNSNGNPFAVPSPIISNIVGGKGIFTGLTFDRDTILIP